MTNFRPAYQMLRIGIPRLLSGDIRLSQERFIDTILHRVQMKNCNGIATPIESDI
jgi:hypothetical protein